MTTSLATFMSRIEVLLLDFDGPVCALFATFSASAVADRLRSVAASHGLTATAKEPLALLREVDRAGDPTLSRAVGNAAQEAEIEAALGATQTPGIQAVLEAAKASRRRVAIVSNNSDEAIAACLARHSLTEHVDLVVGRYFGMPAQLLKPDPHLVQLALTRLDASANTAAFVGDSVTDIEAGRAASVRTIGYANKPGKHERLTTAGPDYVITRMTDLAESMHAAAASRS
ncbi:HAD family hydrolase [Dactylosporangium sp. CA-152071]|uniref:HAD family hydrolase n=1 Tax=Dactylosporangium sp. CA-152071 TaxID=3239933 RepID=UPI003D917708